MSENSLLGQCAVLELDTPAIKTLQNHLRLQVRNWLRAPANPATQNQKQSITAHPLRRSAMAS